MRVTCPTNTRIFIDDRVLDTLKADPVVVAAILIKYAMDGGVAPGDFTVYDSWLGRPGLTLAAELDGRPWALQYAGKGR